MIEFSVRGYPWEEEQDLPEDKLKHRFKGCVLLAVKDDDFAKLDGSTLEYCKLGMDFRRHNANWRLIALPYKKESLSYAIQEKNGSWQRDLDFEGVSADSLDPKIKDGMFDIIKTWSGFFDLLSTSHRTPDGQRVLIRFDELPRILKGLDEHDGDVYKPLIVKISRELTKPLPAIAASLRKILNRKDQMVKLDKVMEINLSSMRWLVRQPGRTIEQKAAANDYHVLAVTRKDNYDLLENRVLKDFLVRSISACTEYLKDSKGSVAGEVKRYRNICRDLLTIPELSEVKRQSSLPVPNYVLQFDARYTKIWHYYVMLLRQEKIAEELFFWQYFTFLDLCALFCGAALHDLQDDPLQAEGHEVELAALGSCNVSIYPDAKEGVLLNADSTPGPFILTVDGKSFVVQFVIDATKIDVGEGQQRFAPIQQRAAKFASAMGSRSYLLVEPVNARGKQQSLILLYGLNFNLSQEGVSSAEILKSVEKGMADFDLDMRLTGTSLDLFSLVVLCTKEDEEPSKSSNAVVTTMGAQLSRWPEAFARFKKCLFDLLIKVAA